MRFNVLISEVRSSLLFASNDESRLAINGVRFEVRQGKRPVMVSTDGRRLTVIESEAPQDDDWKVDRDYDFTVSSEFLKPLLAFVKTQAVMMAIEYHPSVRVVFYLIGSDCVVDSEKGAVIDMAFPNWRQVLPAGEKEPVPEVGLNAEFLADFAKAAKLLDVAPLIRVHLFTTEGAMEVHISGKVNFYGVIMPTRGEETDQWQPEFLGMEKPVENKEAA